MKNEIQHKVIAITGASSGIGKATAELLAGQGAKVVLGARRTDRLLKIIDAIEQNGGEAACLEVDVTRREDLAKLTTLAIERFGRLDVMINNAGISQLYKMEELDVDGWEQMIDVNLKGTLYGIAAALPIFKEQGSGHIINVISTAGISIVPTMGVYAGTKNAVRTIGEALRQESRGRWRVTGISPGYVATEFASHIKNEEVRNTIQQNADQMAIPADAIARAIAYAIEQPDNVDVGDIVIRPSVQS
ncbi:SDR family oxidoreductase [Mucilaginibacter sp. SG564]|uniref:SDR family oxidoreductase n=1 Tax=Mucilaginibacter sp. SG564 TaxID=2587022 RepID=UPI001552E037|nr:SDR family oxidoreductase [Mucilaginibacter sp. SG564]NOW96455.1 NADP-dependent 3-hydroxy acid dehydrogenase YdfG [Mucilaginibacter sp. SG564]